MAHTVGIVSLGCSKNQIDGEQMLARLEAAGWTVKDDAALCDVAIVNTCGFIQAAKQESIEEILELAKLKAEGQIQAIVVTGCLSERYREEIRRELPEADAVVGIGANAEIVKICEDVLAGGHPEIFPPKECLPLSGPRHLLTPSYFAYVKIAEGCKNRCAYCAIPLIRGAYRSRPIEEIEDEARTLIQNGAKELVLVAQDTTRYGEDLYKSHELPRLLKRLCALDGDFYIRVLYCYPDFLTEDLLDPMAKEPNILKYLDLPLQHCSGRILRAMHRWGDRGKLEALLSHVREKVPGVTLRTTLMVGFPGETEEDFEELCEFAKRVRFDHMGCFAYSAEEGTEAAALPDQIDEDVKSHRVEVLMEQQMALEQAAGEALVGKTVRVLVEGWDRWAECWFARAASQAPDDIDGKVYFHVPKDAKRRPVLGQFAEVEIADCLDGDLVGTYQESGAQGGC